VSVSLSLLQVVEARELKGREDSGISDPICYVIVNKEKQKTKVMKKTLNCVWDHCFFFDLKMNQKEFENGVVEFQVFDANTIRRDELIGGSAVDLQTVYAADHHELYKSWVALTDDSGEHQGVQGYLCFSATVVPDGEDMPPPHADDDDDDIDIDNVDLADLVLNAPNIQLQQFAISAKIYRGDGIPAMDRNGKADPFIQVKIGGTRVATQYQKATLEPVFNQELIVPAKLPSLSDRIEVLLYDWDMASNNDLIGACYFSFEEIRNRPFGPNWVHFYGAAGGDCGGDADDYNRGFREGSAYRGRLLMDMSAKPMDKVKPKVSFVKKAAPDTKTDHYVIWLDVYEGAEVLNTSNTVHLEFQVGSAPPLKVESKQSKKGSCQFYNQTEYKFELPTITDFDAVNGAPDLLINCYVKKLIGKSRVGYLRVPLKSILGFNHTPKWHEFSKDTYGYKYGESDTPGTFLMNLNCGKFINAADERPQMIPLEHQEFELRTHLYQASALPAADDNGLSDPYVEVRIGGSVAKTDKQLATVNPRWYKTLTMKTKLPTPLEYAPDINVLIMDWDQFSGDDLMGRFKFKASDASAEMPDKPTWYDCYFDNPQQTEGKVLAAFQLIPLADAKNVPMPDLMPATKDCYFEINVVGLRSMVPYQLQGISNPRIEFDVGDAKSRNVTKNKARVTNADADVLETVILSVPMPLDELYAPTVNVRVFDQRTTGDVLVGTNSIPIAEYLPWVIEAKRVELERQQRRLTQAQHGTATSDSKELVPVAGNDTGRRDTLSDYNALSPAQRLVANRTRAAPADSNVDPTEIEMNEDDDADDVKIDIAEEDEFAYSGDDDDEDYDGGATGSVEAVDAAALLDDDSDLDDVSESDDDKEDETPVVNHELEVELADDMPFETFELFRGKARGLNAFQKLVQFSDDGQGTRITAGTLKARFRVIENERLMYVDDPINLKAVYRPKDYVVRLYMLKGTSIVPHDDNGFSDPYLIIDTGVKKTTKKEGCLVEKTQNPEFYHCYELPTRIPGPPLRIQCWDHDLLSADDLIGETVIDLENRFFCPKWQEMEPKWIEQRTLWTDSSRSAQGKLEMFIEVMTAKEAKRTPLKDIAPPSAVPHEFRVVVWETKDVALLDDNKSDIFVSGMFDGQERQDTDCHWKATDGFGSFNWRMKFPIELPMANPRFKIQLWDKDLLSANDIICEASLDLSKHMKRALKSQKMFKFEEKWLEMFHPNEGAAVRGRVKVTMELLSKELADSLQCGNARDEPNNYPFLPKPDRPDDSFNPLNPLGWMKLGGGALFGQAKKMCAILAVVAVIVLLIKFAF
jgi:C2 domain